MSHASGMMRASSPCASDGRHVSLMSCAGGDRSASMASSSTQNRMSVLRDLQIPLVSTLWLVVYSEFLFSALGQNFFDLCTDTVNPYFAEGT